MIRKIIPTGNEELDIRLGGGIPYPTIILIEGDHGSGKSALAQQFLYGALRLGLRGFAIITESRPKEYIKSMEEIQLKVTRYYILGMLTVLSLHLRKFKWKKEYGRVVLPILSNYLEGMSQRYDIFLLDSLTQLLTYAPTDVVLNFMTRLRIIASKGKGIIMTMHPHTVADDLGAKIRGMCDGYIKVSNEAIGDRIYKVMSIIKMKGMPPGAETSVTFDVDPAMGIKIVPIKAAKA